MLVKSSLCFSLSEEEQQEDKLHLYLLDGLEYNIQNNDLGKGSKKLMEFSIFPTRVTPKYKIMEIYLFPPLRFSSFYLKITQKKISESYPSLFLSARSCCFFGKQWAQNKKEMVIVFVKFSIGCNFL